MRTIQARILRDEQRAGYLLELYQQVRLAEEQSQVIADETLEQSELQLSGLVVRQEGKLRIYNQIYREIFNFNWIKTQLNNLRPYSENYRFWVASRGNDESRLLRGHALQEAEEWARDKNLSFQDKQYLAASKEKEIQEEIAAKQQEAAVERERQNREAADERYALLDKANKKAKRQIRNGTIMLIITFSITIYLGFRAFDLQEQINKSQELLQDAKKLANSIEPFKSKKKDTTPESFIKNDRSIKISDYNLQMALINLALAVVYQKEKKNLAKAEIHLNKSYGYINKSEENADSREKIQTSVLYLIAKARFLNERADKNKKIESYIKAYNFIQQHKEVILSKNLNILSKSNVEYFYKKLIFLEKEFGDVNLKNKVETSLIQYYYTELEDELKSENIKSSDDITTKFISYLVEREGDKLNKVSVNTLQAYCLDLRKIDNLWDNYTKEFSFSAQKSFFRNTPQSRKFINNEISTIEDVQKPAKTGRRQKWNIFSIFLPPAIAATQPMYPSLGLVDNFKSFSQSKIISACPFKTDSAVNALIFAPPSNIRGRPGINSEIKCSITSQEIIRVYTNFNNTWYYTDACNGGWINKTQVRLTINQQ